MARMGAGASRQRIFTVGMRREARGLKLASRSGVRHEPSLQGVVG